MYVSMCFWNLRRHGNEKTFICLPTNIIFLSVIKLDNHAWNLPRERQNDDCCLVTGYDFSLSGPFCPYAVIIGESEPYIIMT